MAVDGIQSVHGAHQVPCPAATVSNRAHARPNAASPRVALLGALLASTLLLHPDGAFAAPSCTITSTGGLAFGTYDPSLGGALDGLLSVQVKCPKVLTPQALLSRGSAPTFLPRTLRNGSETLEYNVYLDAGRTVVWGDGTEGTSAWLGP